MIFWWFSPITAFKLQSYYVDENRNNAVGQEQKDLKADVLRDQQKDRWKGWHQVSQYDIYLITYIYSSSKKKQSERCLNVRASQVKSLKASIIIIKFHRAITIAEREDGNRQLGVTLKQSLTPRSTWKLLRRGLRPLRGQPQPQRVGPRQLKRTVWWQ